MSDPGITPQSQTPATPKRIVKVTSSMIEAARAQVAISRQLGRPVSKVVEKIAVVR